MSPVGRPAGRKPSHAIVLALLVALITAVSPNVAAAAAKRTVLKDVHTDTVHVTWSGGKLGNKVRVGGPGNYRYYTPGKVIFQLKDVAAARQRVPDASKFRFLGQPGATIWTAPQTQDQSILFPGWDTEAIKNGTFKNDTLTFELVSVSGPGKVEIYQVGSFGDVIRLYSSSNESYRKRSVPARAHIHANWSFTKKGRYVLKWKVSAKRASDGTRVTTGTISHVWAVGKVDPAWR